MTVIVFSSHYIHKYKITSQHLRKYFYKFYDFNNEIIEINIAKTASKFAING